MRFLCHDPSSRLVSLSVFDHLLTNTITLFSRGRLMLANSEYADRLNRLAEKTRRADDVSPDLIADIIGHACPRLKSMGPNGNPITRITDFIKCCAWIDASLALVETQLPKWTLRRLAYENGEWHCSLSKQNNLPLELDDTADAHHEVAALAILSAFLEVQSRAMEKQTTCPSVPQVRTETAYLFCCDNFA
jgi:hypothetical protein